MHKITAALVFLGLAAPVFALKTAYVSFDHPDGWRCELSQGVWICQSTLEGERRESVVLSIATMASEWDTLENYLDYLKKTRVITDDQGKPVESKVTYARKRDINGVVWVDSLQKNSELPGFWSRYVATVYNKLAILITYVVSEDQYQRLAPQFERMVASLKPNAEFDLNIASKQGETPLPGATKLGPVQSNIIRERLKLPTASASPKAETPEEPSGDSTLPLVGGLVAVLAVVYLILRRRQGKRKNNTNQNRAA